MTVAAHELKNERLNVRVTTRQREVIEQAARASAKPVSAFIMDAAYADAQRVLSEQRLFLLDAERWERFIEALDRPVAEKPRLRKLMRTPSILEKA